MALTRADYENYGSDLVDFASRAAIQATRPHLDYLQNENEELRVRLAREARARLDQQVEIALPEWRQIDSDPRWHQWLLMPDEFTGRVRQELLNEAIADGSASRVLSFFRTFQQQAGGGSGGGEHRASRSGGRRTSSDPAAGGRIWTRPDIKAAYEAHRKGRWAGREAEWQRLEQEIISAGAQGRIAGGIEPRGR